MKSKNLFQLGLSENFDNPRQFAFKIGFTLLLTIPIIIFPLPIRARSSSLVFLILFMSFFGAAVAQVRRNSEQITTKLALLPVSRKKIFFDIVLADSCIDCIQFIPTLILFSVFCLPVFSISAFVRLSANIIGVIVLLNGSGVALGLILKSNQEVHLVAALFVASLALFSGLIPVPEHLHWIQFGKTFLNPLTSLNNQLLFLLSKGHEGTLIYKNTAGVIILIISFCIVWRGLKS